MQARRIIKRWRARNRTGGIHHRREKSLNRPVETVECGGVALHSNNHSPGSPAGMRMIRKIRLISDHKTIQSQGPVRTKLSDSYEPCPDCFTGSNLSPEIDVTLRSCNAFCDGDNGVTNAGQPTACDRASGVTCL